MNAPQIIWIALTTAYLAKELVNDGQCRKPSKHNFASGLIASGLMAALLWWGGFFGGAS